MNSPLNTFDEFVDDLLSSDVDLLNGELDFLIMQSLFHSNDLGFIKNNESEENNSIAA